MNNKLIVIYNYIFSYYYFRDKFIYLFVRLIDMILFLYAIGKRQVLSSMIFIDSLFFYIYKKLFQFDIIWIF